MIPRRPLVLPVEGPLAVQLLHGQVCYRSFHRFSCTIMSASRMPIRGNGRQELMFARTRCFEMGRSTAEESQGHPPRLDWAWGRARRFQHHAKHHNIFLVVSIIPKIRVGLGCLISAWGMRLRLNPKCRIRKRRSTCRMNITTEENMPVFGWVDTCRQKRRHPLAKTRIEPLATATAATQPSTRLLISTSISSPNHRPRVPVYNPQISFK